MKDAENAITYGDIFASGLLKDNPTLRQMLGLCPTLAVTTAVTNGLGMGLATTFVLVCSEVVVSLLRRHIPPTVRIPAFITIIASFVTLTMMLVSAYAPALDEALGMYLSLIVVNCIVLGRAEAFASKQGVLKSAADGLASGLGFTLALVAMSAIRELFGAGTLLGVQVLPSFIEPMLILVQPTGGFAVLAILVAIVAVFDKHTAEKVAASTPTTMTTLTPEGVQNTLCAACPLDCGLKDPEHIDCVVDDEYQVDRRRERSNRRPILQPKSKSGGDAK